ncbi:MAG: DsbA family protein [Rhizobiales bacterium]|nr:DsbA family protein [Hyphomicrobiales bacterium]MBI3673625.1 DsbA family protein [Hyphomicrobiales bacterium]
MNRLNRRDLLAAAAAVATLPWLGRGALAAIDLAALNKPPELGEMELGNPKSKVTMIEYASATCPHCAVFDKEAFPQLKKEYIDTNKIRFVFREYVRNDADLAAFMIARSLPKDAYFPLMDIYFTTQETWTAGNWGDGLFNIAKQAGFTQEKFDATIKDAELARKILAIRDGGESFGVQGTPTFFINGDKLEGEQKIETLRAKIDPLLA